MKILILANNDVGLYKFRKELIQKLISQGNEVYISLPEGEFIKHLVEMGCKFVETNVDRRGLNPIKDIKLLLHYFTLLNKVKPNLVITYTIKPNIYGGILCRFKNIAYAVNITGLGTAFHGSRILKKVVIFLYKIASKRAKVLFFENDENQSIFIHNKIVFPKNALNLNGAGVNLEEYQFTEYPSCEETRILFIGRVMKEKGIEELLEVARRLKGEYSNLFFDIVGPIEDDYRPIIKKLQEENVVNYYGFQSDVRPYIKKSHCFVLPSYHEGMANTLLEAGALGRPLVTSNIFGCKEAVNDKENGYLVRIKDIEDLYEKIKEFIHLPYEEKVEMGRKSREHIVSKFDKKKIIETTLKELKK
ncbi:glycosyltransferase family 4 protein [Neobacillus vireti]|uniref:glycosyltransferase family 4 protein n=1 Tax=Neobacillus vireti TaxID=220686 RepID=UPI002FFEA70F